MRTTWPFPFLFGAPLRLPTCPTDAQRRIASWGLSVICPGKVCPRSFPTTCSQELRSSKPPSRCHASLCSGFRDAVLLSRLGAISKVPRLKWRFHRAKTLLMYELRGSLLSRPRGTEVRPRELGREHAARPGNMWKLASADKPGCYKKLVPAPHCAPLHLHPLGSYGVYVMGTGRWLKRCIREFPAISSVLTNKQTMVRACTMVCVS